MHDLIQEMGLQIVREESIDEPEGRSRLWEFDEIYDVLTNNVGSNKVEGIQLNVYRIRDIHLEADIFEKMPNIRFLRVYSGSFWCNSRHVLLPKGLKVLPKKMRSLERFGFPLESLSSTFCPVKLFKLSMPYSHHLQKLWDGVQDLVSLQEIELSGCYKLQELPDLSKSLKLKVVRLRDCHSLCYVHSSILSLHSLVELNLYCCYKLRSLKSEFHLRSLQHIDVDLCWNLKEFSLSSDDLRKLDLRKTGIEILHSSVGRSSKLEMLDLNCLRLVDLPNQLSCLTSLTILKLSNCEIIDDSKLHVLFGGMLSLRQVELAKCCNITELPNNTKNLLGLESLGVWNCRRLRSLPELPPSLSRLDADYCKSLEIVSTCRPLRGGPVYFSFLNCVQLNEQSIHNITEAACSIIDYASHTNTNHMDVSSIRVCGSKVPRWFKYRAAQSSVIVELPQISDYLFFCIVIGLYSQIDCSVVSLECTCYLEGEAGGRKVANSQHRVNDLKTKNDHVFIWNDVCKWALIMSIIRKGDQQLFSNLKLRVKFTVETRYKVMIKECGVCPVYASEYQKFVEQVEMERKKKRPQDVEEQQPLLHLKKFKF